MSRVRVFVPLPKQIGIPGCLFVLIEIRDTKGSRRFDARRIFVRRDRADLNLVKRITRHRVRNLCTPVGRQCRQPNPGCSLRPDFIFQRRRGLIVSVTIRNYFVFCRRTYHLSDKTSLERMEEQVVKYHTAYSR